MTKKIFAGWANSLSWNTKTIKVVDPKENINQKPVDVSKLKNDRTPIIIEPNIPKMIGSTFFDIFIYIFFGHLLAIIIGVIFNEILGISFISLGLSVGLTITLMMYFKVIHPPAAANPIIALFADVSVNYILFPVIAGSVSIIILSIILNRYLLKRNYPKRWF